MNPPPIGPTFEERWIYGSELLLTAAPDPSPTESLHNGLLPTVVPDPSSLPFTGFLWSLSGQFAGWVLGKLSPFKPQPRTGPDLGQDAQPTIVAPLDHLMSYTEFAIATESGLKTYVYNPVRNTLPEHLPSCISEAEEEDLTNYSPLEIVDSCYRKTKYGAKMVLRHLRRQGFQETPSELAQPLGNQLFAYFSMPPNDPAAPGQIRWLVLTGLNSDVFGFKINDRVTCSWSQLRRMLQRIPTGVIVVVVLACCRAERALIDLVDGPPIPRLVLIASCQLNEYSAADNLNIDYFLSALFATFEHDRLGQNVRTWEDLLKTIVSELKKTSPIKQNPVIYSTSDLPPSYLCGSLMNSLSTEYPVLMRAMAEGMRPDDYARPDMTPGAIQGNLVSDPYSSAALILYRRARHDSIDSAESCLSGISSSEVSRF